MRTCQSRESPRTTRTAMPTQAGGPVELEVQVMSAGAGAAPRPAGTGLLVHVSELPPASAMLRTTSTSEPGGQRQEAAQLLLAGPALGDEQQHDTDDPEQGGQGHQDEEQLGRDEGHHGADLDASGARAARRRGGRRTAGGVDQLGRRPESIEGVADVGLARVLAEPDLEMLGDVGDQLAGLVVGQPPRLLAQSRQVVGDERVHGAGLVHRVRPSRVWSTAFLNSDQAPRKSSRACLPSGVRT